MSDFGKNTTTDEVLEGVDLGGCRVVITGGAGGLGFESARVLAAHGASVTLLARSAERVSPALTELRALVPGADLESGVVDLADLSSVRSFADSYLADHDAIDVLINNAGVMACPFGHTVDGFETQFGTNHLGHFLLTALLSPALSRGTAPRVVTLSSAGHSRSDVDLADPNFERGEYSPWVAYGRSKTANALFARELARRGEPCGLLSFSVHPGAIITELGRHLTEDLMNEMIEFSQARSEAAESAGAAGATESAESAESAGAAGATESAESAETAETAETGTDASTASERVGGGMEFKTVEAGAATQVWAATAPELAADNGAYLADCGLGVLGANPGANGYLAYLTDDDNAAALWELSEELVGAAFALEPSS